MIPKLNSSVSVRLTALHYEEIIAFGRNVAGFNTEPTIEHVPKRFRRRRQQVRVHQFDIELTGSPAQVRYVLMKFRNQFTAFWQKPSLLTLRLAFRDRQRYAVRIKLKGVS
jgi:hypothetical protein